MKLKYCGLEFCVDNFVTIFKVERNCYLFLSINFTIIGSNSKVIYYQSIAANSGFIVWL